MIFGKIFIFPSVVSLIQSSIATTNSHFADNSQEFSPECAPCITHKVTLTLPYTLGGVPSTYSSGCTTNLPIPLEMALTLILVLRTNSLKWCLK